VLIAQLNLLNIKFIAIDPHPASPATFSQLVRLFAYKLSHIAPDDYVVATDRQEHWLHFEVWRLCWI
jgi:predicted phosphatase